MPYPEQSVLMGSGPRDAWFVAAPINPRQAPNREDPVAFLIETSGGFLIRRLQETLQSEYVANVSVLPSFNAIDLDLTGRWDANTARAVMLLADKSGIVKDIYSDPDYIDVAWGQYYQRHWGKQLTTLALAILTNRSLVDVITAAAIGTEASLDPTTGSPFPNLSGNFAVELSRDCILPRWDFAPHSPEFFAGDRGASTETWYNVFVRRL